MTEGKCPSCGAPVEFRAGDASVVVCGSCQAVVARTDRGLEGQGKVAALVDTDSPLRVGLSGAVHGKEPFRVAGRLQRSNGTSTWDEWALRFDDGRDGWLAESEGCWRLMFEGQAPSPLPREAKPGGLLALDGKRFVVEEVGHAKVVSAEGELPRGFSPGVSARFVEATGPGGEFAYLETLQGDAALFLGQELPVSALGLDEGQLYPTSRRVKLVDVRCTQCNGPLEFRAPDLAQRVACPFCGALLDCSRGNLRFLEKVEKPRGGALKLGSKGKLFGVEWTVLAHLQRSCRVDGVRYGWHEYLLWQKEAGFRWLMESTGHWTFLQPIPAGEVTEKGRVATYRGERFRLFQEVTAQTDAVAGECYWEVAVGDATRAAEFVAPPNSLNVERTEDEVSWTYSTYVTHAELQAAFSAKHLPTPEGIAPSQPNPVGPETRANLKWAWLAAALVLAVHLVLSAQAGARPLFSKSFTAQGLSGTPESMVFGAPFTLDSATKLELRGEARGLDNSWAMLEVDLVDASSQVTAAGFEFDSYSGVEDGERWAEGETAKTEVLPRMAAGSYQVRLVPTWEPGKPPPGFILDITETGPRFLWVFWAWVLLLAWPIVQSMRHSSFETARWMESGVSAGGGDE